MEHQCSNGIQNNFFIHDIFHYYLPLTFLMIKKAAKTTNNITVWLTIFCFSLFFKITAIINAISHKVKKLVEPGPNLKILASGIKPNKSENISPVDINKTLIRNIPSAATDKRLVDITLNMMHIVIMNQIKYNF